MHARPGSVGLFIAALLAGLALAPAASAAAFAEDDFPVVLVDSNDNSIPVLENDFGDATLSASGATDPAHGTASCADTSCTYTPDAGYVGEDQFDYTVSDGSEATDTGTVFVTVVRNEADLAVYSWASPNPVGTSEQFAYNIEVYNQSRVASGDVTLQVQVPTGLAGTLPAGCTNAPGTTNDIITCTASPIDGWGFQAFSIPLTAPSTTGSLTVGAQVSASSPPTDPESGNNVTSAEVTVLDGGDLQVYTWADDADAGANVTFNTYTYNGGPKAAGPVVTTNTITGGTVESASAPQCNIAEPSGGAQVVTCTALEDPMAASSSDNATIVVNPATDDAVVTNVASVSAAGNSDHEPRNDTDRYSAVSGSPALANVSTWKWGERFAVAGEAYTYHLDVSNYGPETATGVTLSDTLPSGMTVTSITTDRGTCTDSDTSFSCNLGDMAVWDYAYIQVVVAVAADAQGVKKNTVTVAATSADRYTTDNSASTETKIIGPGDTDLAAGIYGESLGAVNTPHTLTAYVYNAGPAAGTATLEVQMPPGGFPETGDGSPHAVLDDGTTVCPYNADTNKVVCAAVSIAQHDWRSVDVTTTPNLTGAAAVGTTAILTSGTDPDPENNSHSMSLSVVPAGSADLAVTMHESADPAAVGDVIEYTVGVQNYGPFTAPDVTITDTLPIGPTFVSATREDGSACPAPSSSGVIDCAVGNLPPWHSASITVRVSPTTTGTITNTASADAATGEDPESTNNSASQSTVVNPDVADGGAAEAATGQTYVDPETGQFTISMPSGNRSAVTVQAEVTCPTPPGGPLNSVTFVLGTQQEQGGLVGENCYEATFDSTDLAAGDVEVVANCGGTAIANGIGKIELYDPSGIITDANSGAPVVGATVTLYRVPGWSARTSAAQNGTPETCESNLSKPNGADWSQPAPTNLGVEADPASGLIDPAVNPQQTNAQGRYGWNVAAGCWYVVVEKAGYQSLTSPVVGVPPEVTDLDLELTPVSAGGGSANGNGTATETGGGDTAGGSTTGGTPGATTTTPPVTTPPVTTPAASKCVVPKLKGLTLRKARRALARAKCGVGRITRKKARRVRGKLQKRGTVIAQKPAPGTRKPAGSKVAIVLAS